MRIIDTHIEGLFVLEPRVFSDDRGYFMETFRATHFENMKPFIQDNEAKSNAGVLRGLHFQKGNSAQAKLVRVVNGSVYDVAVDLRPNSKTFGSWYGIELTEKNKLQMYVPRDFAHGYLVLEDNTIFTYKCDNFYDYDAENGIPYDDPTVGIEWPSIQTDFVLSEKDKNWQSFDEFKKNMI